MKICKKCGAEKASSEFYGKQRDCKSCYKERVKQSNSLGYGSWRSIKSRCLNKNCSDYPKYGGSGIGVCAGIASSYEHFMSIVGTRPSLGHSIDRIDNGGDYTCGDCVECKAVANTTNIRWATHTEQMLNRGRFKSNKDDGAGIERDKVTGRWKVRIGVNGVRRRLGSYNSREDAILAKKEHIANLA